MIDITISPISREVSVENIIYSFAIEGHSAMGALLEEVINRAKYSGESISLCIIEGDSKRIINQW